jgi:alanine racemase
VVEGRSRQAWAEVDLGAVRHNVSLLARRAAPAAVYAVVKADAYGHGAVPVGAAALEAGAAGLAVAIVDEGLELRDAGVRAPVLVLSEPAPGTEASVVRAGLSPTVASSGALRALGAAARRAGRRVAVHVKVDTGMHRVGVAPEEAAGLVAAAAGEDGVDLDGVCTHLPVADGTGEGDRTFTAAQLEVFEKVVAGLPARPRLLHAANTAGAVAWPASRYDLVRCGIGVYGVAPSDALSSDGAGPERAAAFLAELRPALSLKARVSAVRELDAGARPSYGRLRALPERAIVATVPLGYADGVRRGLFSGGCPVLVGGSRRPLAGTVTMDQLMVDCGPGAGVAPGDEVVLLGRQGDETVTAAEWARALGTIAYEVLCGVGPRVPRVYVDGAAKGAP